MGTHNGNAGTGATDTGATDTEYSSVEDFVQYCMDDDRTTYTTDDLIQLADALDGAPRLLRRELAGYGLTLCPRAPERRVRGFTTSSNDRWYGPGSSPTHGGSGGDQIEGWAPPPMVSRNGR